VTLTSVRPAPLLDVSSLTPLRVALLGCGVVGSEVARLIIGQAADLRARVGRPWSWSASLCGSRIATAEASIQSCLPPTPRRWSPARTSIW
jgi:hypothetical protein